ncbi:RNA polymerase sigma factor [Bacillus phage BigBertha]|uniref:RNA polymerase sigma factor n=1 Tax=Bacillus phage BigBertha TaxID=1406781 RepID=U5PS43_9CAUD|nr:RNA polymerase sigma factor [Bacillus phage BigBertha]AGY46709.1 RNA polymerase sigma factor [Bacillus phage BigBertha]ULF48826.1 RNA polymerase sigma factor [Bacillus phage BillyBob]
MLTVAEKKIKNYDLLVQAKEGSEDAMEQLIKNYDKFLHKEVDKITKVAHKKQDLYQVGAMTLVESVHKFDLDSGYEFLSYLYMQVRGHMLNSLRDIRVAKTPTKLVDLSSKIKKRGLSDEPADHISKVLEEPVEKVYDALIYLRNEIPLSTNAQVEGGEKKSNNASTGTLGDMIEKDINGDDWEEMSELQYYIDKLPEKERFVITERYINDKKQSTVGQALNIKQQSVARIEKYALDNLRSLMSGNGLIIREDNRGKGRKNVKGNQELAKELVMKGKLKQAEIHRLTGVPSGTIAYWVSRLKKGEKI